MIYFFTVWFPPQSKDMQDRSMGDSKLSLGVSVNECVCACVSPVMDRPYVQGGSLPTGQDAGIG